MRLINKNLTESIYNSLKEGLSYDVNEPNTMDIVRYHRDNNIGGSILINTYSDNYPSDPPTKKDIGKVVYDLRAYDNKVGFEAYEVVEDEDYPDGVKFKAIPEEDIWVDDFDFDMSDDEVDAYAKEKLGLNKSKNESTTITTGETTIITDNNGAIINDNNVITTVNTDEPINITVNKTENIEDIEGTEVDEPESDNKDIEVTDMTDDSDVEDMEDTELTLEGCSNKEEDKKLEGCSNDEDKKLEGCSNKDEEDLDMKPTYEDAQKMTIEERQALYKEATGKEFESDDEFWDWAEENLSITINENDKEKLDEAEQTIDIFQNPKFDYKLTDITVLQNTSPGDVRSLDMDDILVGLDESLSKRYNNPNYINLNSFYGKKGDKYSSAIVDVSWPGCNGYVLTFESSYNDNIYECTVRDTTSNKKLTHLCAKTTNPIKVFENAIVELVTLKTKLNEHENLLEDIELIHNHRENKTPEDIDVAKDDRIEKDHEKLDKEVDKRKKDLNKKKKTEEEPDQKNTKGEPLEKLDEAEDFEEVEETKETFDDNLQTEVEKDEEELLKEETLPAAIFHFNPTSVESMIKEEENGVVTNMSTYYLAPEAKVELSDERYNEFSTNLQGDYPEIYDKYNAIYQNNGSNSFNCVLVNDNILVDTNGRNKVRFAAIYNIVDNNEEETIVEPEVEEEVKKEEIIEK